jgi:hypothetical protein
MGGCAMGGDPRTSVVDSTLRYHGMDNLFVVDNNVLDPGLFPVAKLQSSTGSSSGVGLLGGAGLRTTTASASGPTPRRSTC